MRDNIQRQPRRHRRQRQHQGGNERISDLIAAAKTGHHGCRQRTSWLTLYRMASCSSEILRYYHRSMAAGWASLPCLLLKSRRESSRYLKSVFGPTSTCRRTSRSTAPPGMSRRTGASETATASFTSPNALMRHLSSQSGAISRLYASILFTARAFRPLKA